MNTRASKPIPSAERQAEVEITDEMIEAGREVLAEYSQREDDPGWIVSAIFSAMWESYGSSRPVNGQLAEANKLVIRVNGEGRLIAGPRERPDDECTILAQP